jgi:predicted translin family RNA/ssDNA-binding protein
MKKITMIVGLLFCIYCSNASAKEQGFLYSQSGYYYANFILWDRQGNNINGKWFEIKLTDSYEYYVKNLNLSGKIQGSSVSLIVGAGLNTGKLSGNRFTLTIPSADGGIEQRVFTESTVASFNKLVASYKADSVRLQNQLQKKEDARLEATTLNNEVTEMESTALEAMEEINMYQETLSSYLDSPNKMPHPDESGASPLNNMVKILKDSTRIKSNISFNVSRKDCDYLPDIKNDYEKLNLQSDLVKDLPSSSEYYLNLINNIYKKASERLDIALSKISRVNKIIASYQIDIEPSSNTTQLQARKRSLESQVSTFKASMKNFDAKIKESAIDYINQEVAEAQTLIGNINCPK